MKAYTKEKTAQAFELWCIWAKKRIDDGADFIDSPHCPDCVIWGGSAPSSFFHRISRSQAAYIPSLPVGDISAASAAAINPTKLMGSINLSEYIGDGFGRIPGGRREYSRNPEYDRRTAANPLKGCFKEDKKMNATKAAIYIAHGLMEEDIQTLEELRQARPLMAVVERC